jgi:hypothetical protein
VSSSVRFAPTFALAVRRTVLIVLAAALVGILTGVVMGAPSAARALEHRRAPFGPTFPIGLVQFGSQAALFALAVYIGRRWLRMKL